MRTDAEFLQAAIDRAREDKRPSLEQIMIALSFGMDAARNSADGQSQPGRMILDPEAYRLLYYAAYDAKKFLERGINS